MIWLLFSILLNTYIGIVFKIFQRFGISNLQGIVFNYFVCVITGCFFLGFQPFANLYFQQAYFPFAILQGFSFFLVFSLISKSTLANGVSATQVANKLSLVIPVIAAHFLFSDSISLLKIIGIFLAGAAVYLSSKKTKNITDSIQNHIPNKITIGTKFQIETIQHSKLFLPILIFFGSGFLDSLTSFIQKKYFHQPNDENIYIIFCFASAAFFGGIYLLFQYIKQKEIFKPKYIVAGVFLGVPNFFSIYTFIYALKSNVFQTSALVPVNNIGVVFASTVCAVLFFKEKLIKQNYFGLLLALIAICLIVFGD